MSNHWIDQPVDGAATHQDRLYLLENYAKISSRRRGAAAATALRSQSSAYLDILATEACGYGVQWSELMDRFMRVVSLADQKAVDGFIKRELNPRPIAEIGNHLLVASSDRFECFLGVQMLMGALNNLPADKTTRRWRQSVVQFQILEGSAEQASKLLDRWRDLDRMNFGYLRAELMNPFGDGRGSGQRPGSQERWLENFNRTFTDSGLEPIHLALGQEKPFDRLRCSAPAVEVSDSSSKPLVSVVMTTYRPDATELRTSVNSILNQTVKEIELIVIDDASGPEYQSLLDEIAALDTRVKVHSMTSNSGTYICRNVGLSLASGKYFTGQDDDDWSHPRRLERQLRFLTEHPGTPACRVEAVLVGEDLCRVRIGYKPQGPNASTFMAETKLVRDVGGFLEARKAADTELVKRIEAMGLGEVQTLAVPLTIVRILQNSLSRNDFSAGWSHPARDHFKSSYAYWHRNSDPAKLTEPPEVAIPRRFSVFDKDGSYDVVLAGDWKKFGGPQKSMLEEIDALVSGGYRVGIMHLEAARFMSTKSAPLNDAIQAKLNSGQVDEVFYDDEVSIRLLVLRYPPILQFPPDLTSKLKADRFLILANQAPAELDGSDPRYIVADCTNNGSWMFGQDATWVPQGPQVRKAIEPWLKPNELEDFNMPGILEPTFWARHSRPRIGNRVPVIGRHSRDDSMKFPDRDHVLRQVYPVDGSVSVRMMGGGKTPLRVLGTDQVPANWEILERDEEPVREFLHSLDFFIFFQHPEAVEAFGRSILEAIAAETFVILPPHYEEVFGSAAVYCEASEVKDTIFQYWKNGDAFNDQLACARDYLLQNFTHRSYLDRIASIL